MPSDKPVVVPMNGRLPLEPPADLSDEAREIFSEIVRDMGDREITEADAEIVAMLAHSAHIHRYARRQIDATGVLVKGPNGPIVNPLIRLAREEAATYMRLASELGVSYAAKMRLGEVKNDSEDEITLIVAALRGTAEVDDAALPEPRDARARGVESRRAVRRSVDAVATAGRRPRAGDDRK